MKPSAPICRAFVILHGQDDLVDDVARALEFIVVSRPGHPYEIPAGARVQRLDTLDLAISSSEIRTRLAAGDAELDVPTAVLDYIRERNLYSPQM